MISMETINTLCEEAGLEPRRVRSVVITPYEAEFTVISVNIYGEAMVNAEHTEIVTHWVKAQIA